MEELYCSSKWEQTSHIQFCLRLPKSNGLTFTEESRSFSLPKRVERVCDLGVILLYKGISLHPPLAHRQITQWLYATQYCHDNLQRVRGLPSCFHSLAWMKPHWASESLRFMWNSNGQMSSRICFSRRNTILKISLDCLKNCKHV